MTLAYTPNYADENMNIDVPIFIIHGNHDYPSSAQNISAIDVLSASGYVNYFGKVTNWEKIEILPILFHKGKSKVFS